jgi:hypothetical protein
VFRPLNSAGLVAVLRSLNTTNRITCSNARFADPHQTLGPPFIAPGSCISCPLLLYYPRESKMAASLYSYCSSLRLACLVKWTVFKLFKQLQSPTPPSVLLLRIGSFTLLHLYNTQNCFNLPSFPTLTVLVRQCWYRLTEHLVPAAPL